FSAPAFPRPGRIVCRVSNSFFQERAKESLNCSPDNALDPQPEAPFFLRFYRLFLLVSDFVRYLGVDLDQGLGSLPLYFLIWIIQCLDENRHGILGSGANLSQGYGDIDTIDIF